VNVYSGLAGSGSLLKTFTYDPDERSGWRTHDVGFAGTARSIVFNSPLTEFWIDDLQIGTAVPEPSSWAMLILGFGVAGGALRRRKRLVAIA
jgi:hypothetical protein